MPQYETIRIQDKGPVRTITLHQPEIYNPMDEVSGPELIQALEQAGSDDSVRVVVLTGAGKAFSAGGNVRNMLKLKDNGGKSAPWFRDGVANLNRSVIALRRLPKPVVCAMNGVTAGGGLAWALACDLVVAAQSARLDPGYIRIGVSPDGGSSILVTRLMGHKRASAFFLMGKAITAQQALDWGMVNWVVPDGQVMDKALEIAEELARGPAQALASTKALLNQAVFGDLETVLENERQEMVSLVDEPDHHEGLKAFFEKRKPEFR